MERRLKLSSSSSRNGPGSEPTHGHRFVVIITRLERLDGHWRGVVPEPLPDLSELAVAQLAHELEAGPLDLPLVPRRVGEALRIRLVDLERKNNKREIKDFLHRKSQRRRLFYRNRKTKRPQKIKTTN